MAAGRGRPAIDRVVSAGSDWVTSSGGAAGTAWVAVSQARAPDVAPGVRRGVAGCSGVVSSGMGSSCDPRSRGRHLDRRRWFLPHRSGALRPKVDPGEASRPDTRPRSAPSIRRARHDARPSSTRRVAAGPDSGPPAMTAGMGDGLHDAATAFSDVATVYEQARPGYPPSALAWLGEHLALGPRPAGPGPGRRDGQAHPRSRGTGSDGPGGRAGRGDAPDPGRRGSRARSWSPVWPRPSRSAPATVDAITVAQALHWFATAHGGRRDASCSAPRVAPGGGLEPAGPHRPAAGDLAPAHGAACAATPHRTSRANGAASSRTAAVTARPFVPDAQFRRRRGASPSMSKVWPGEWPR